MFKLSTKVQNFSFEQWQVGGLALNNGKLVELSQNF